MKICNELHKQAHGGKSIEKFQGSRTQEDVNRQSLAIIANLCLLLSRQTIANRGHRDSGKILTGDSDINEGNWREQIRNACTLNESFKNFIENAPKNATYTSHATYRNMQKAASKLIIKKIRKSLNKSECH